MPHERDAALIVNDGRRCQPVKRFEIYDETVKTDADSPPGRLVNSRIFKF